MTIYSSTGGPLLCGGVDIANSLSLSENESLHLAARQIHVMRDRGRCRLDLTPQ